MFQRFEIHLDPVIPTEEEWINIVCLRSEEGIHFPIVVDDVELQHLTIAKEEGCGAMPPGIAEAVAEIRSHDLIVAQVLVAGYDEKEGTFDTWVGLATDDAATEDVATVEGDIIWAIELAIHFGAPVYIMDAVVMAVLESEYGERVAEYLQPDEDENSIN